MRDIGGHGSGRRPPAPGPQYPSRHGTNGHAHHPGPGRPYDVSTTDTVDDGGPIDLVELQADDELINALSSGLGVSSAGDQGYDADDRLVAMLASWRADVDAEPYPQLVEPDVAAEVLAPSRRSRRVSYLRPVVAAVAVAACGLGVLSVTAHEAQPGDSLWGLSKVLYSERAEQVQAASDLRTGIERVNAKLAAGDPVGARQELAALAPLLGKVEPGQEQAYFDRQSQFLAAKAAETPPGVPTDPSAPLRNGTPAPPPPQTEGSADPVAPLPAPAPGSSSGTQPGTSPVAPEGTAPGPVEPTPVDPSTTVDPSPSTEGTPDPTETTRPTASGPAGPEPSDTTTGGRSSTTG